MHVRMYAVRGSAPDSVFAKKTQFTLKNYCLAWEAGQWHSVWAIIYGNVNNGTYLDISNNLILPQLQDF